MGHALPSDHQMFKKFIVHFPTSLLDIQPNNFLRPLHVYYILIIIYLVTYLVLNRNDYELILPFQKKINRNDKPNATRKINYINND